MDRGPHPCRSTPVFSLLVSLVTGSLAAGGIALPAAAQTACTTGTILGVNSFFDEADDDLTDGQCLSISGFCTLRAAIEHANFTGGNWRIVLAPGVYALTIGGGGSATASEGDLDIYGANICIQGSTTGPTVLDANGIDRFFDIADGVDVGLENLVIIGGDPGIGSPPGTTSAHGGGVRIGAFGITPPTVTMNSVTIESNVATLPGGSVSSGGGVYNAGTLFVNGCSIRQNTAKNDGGGVFTAAGGFTTIVGGSCEDNAASRGGGIYNSGTTTVTQAFILSNSTSGSGGGIRNSGDLTLVECLIQGNQAGTPPTGVQGGGVDNVGTADVSDSTIRDNSSTGGGGGWSNGALGSADLVRSTISTNTCVFTGGGVQNSGAFFATNCTVSGNTAQGNGGGLYSFAAAATTFRNVTVAFNSAASGGGVLNDAFAPGVCELRNSILSDNFPANFAGTTPLLATGVVLDSDSSALLGPPHISGSLALLGPLGPNGGFTDTHALLPGSPAIDAGSPADCATAGGPLLEDQRGAARPEDGDGSGIAECDLGSFEAPAGAACVAPNWNLIATPTFPGALGEVAMAFDSARGRMVLFGDPGGLSRTWEYDGAWQLVSSAGPVHRWDYRLAYDSIRGVTVLFGGRTNSGVLADTWEWDGISWTPVLTAAMPPARQASSMAFDSARGVVVLFGGRDLVGTFFGDTWEYDGVNWVQRFPANSPSAREGAALAYDSLRGVTVLYAGSAGIVQQDTWEWNGTNWLLRSGVSPPGFRTYHAAAYEVSGLRTLVFGGLFSGDDVWGWDGTSWTQVANIGPGGRTNIAFAHDSSRQVTVMFGGYLNAGGAAQGDTWEVGCPTVAVDPFIRGDCETDMLLNIADPIRLLGALFQGQSINCGDACDANDDGQPDIADAIHLLSGLFSGGPPPPPPNTCGPDPTLDAIRCLFHPC